MASITFKNILSFIEGNFKYLYNEYIGLPGYLQEQIKYRVSLCKDDCLKTGKCRECGCTAEKKILVNKSCNGGKRFPDIMGNEKWKEFKKGI